MSDPNCIKAELFGDTVYFVLDESYQVQLAPGSIIYTLREVQMLIDQPESVRRTVHEAKKLGGAVVESSTKRLKGGQYV